MKKSIILFTLFALFLSAAVCLADVSSALPGDRTTAYQVEGGSDKGDAALYNQAKNLYENKQYYEAYKLFVQSKYGDWEKMSQKCIRRWPKNGELWHDSSQWLSDTMLTFKVDQPSDTAVFIRIFKVENKKSSLISTVFIGGSDAVTVNLPGNTSYMIKDGVGSDWFGVNDAFGEEGAYETMTFTDKEEETYYFERKLDYMITINVENVIGENIGSEDEEWREFTK
ncbi:MAG: hypothetical protein IKP86_02465 [Anaerolineaceae bacterium]|nr:hypothetical protein [Anaerolineaceae bacterium]